VSRRQSLLLFRIPSTIGGLAGKEGDLHEQEGVMSLFGNFNSFSYLSLLFFFLLSSNLYWFLFNSVGIDLYIFIPDFSCVTCYWPLSGNGRESRAVIFLYYGCHAV
jgi:hypothetical protein